MKVMYEHVNKRNGKWSPLLADDVYEIIKEVRTGEPPYPKKLPLLCSSRRCPHFKIFPRPLPGLCPVVLPKP
jgi:hypothetical protein